MLMMSVVLNYQVIVELDVAILAPVAGMFFKDTGYEIIENHHKPYTKCSLASQDQYHFEDVPFVGFQQRHH